jgi:hypothetical protein
LSPDAIVNVFGERVRAGVTVEHDQPTAHHGQAVGQVTMTAPPEYHGPHAAGRQLGAEEVRWHDAEPFGDRVRVIRHSCESNARIFELCAAGGVACVRVTDRLYQGVIVKETHRFRMREAEELWVKTLLSQAR